ncbi:cytidine deaminase-like protein [Melanogaster broomeanus]|nr:cytidine deaminase-like protein [Melanogaster broomeanus]
MPLAINILTNDRQRLIQGAIQAKQHAYSRYSNFRVGAALLSEDGTIITGASIDNACYNASICAERTAIVKAVSENMKLFKGLAVTSDVLSPISPCGICRQVIGEFCAREVPVFLIPADYPKKSEDGSEVEDGGIVSLTVGELLPHPFGLEYLGQAQSTGP